MNILDRKILAQDMPQYEELSKRAREKQAKEDEAKYNAEVERVNKENIEIEKQNAEAEAKYQKELEEYNKQKALAEAAELERTKFDKRIGELISAKGEELNRAHYAVWGPGGSGNRSELAEIQNTISKNYDSAINKVVEEKRVLQGYQEFAALYPSQPIPRSVQKAFVASRGSTVSIGTFAQNFYEGKAAKAEYDRQTSIQKARTAPNYTPEQSVQIQAGSAGLLGSPTPEMKARGDQIKPTTIPQNTVFPFTPYVAQDKNQVRGLTNVDTGQSIIGKQEGSTPIKIPYTETVRYGTEKGQVIPVNLIRIIPERPTSKGVSPKTNPRAYVKGLERNIPQPGTPIRTQPIDTAQTPEKIFSFQNISEVKEKGAIALLDFQSQLKTQTAPSAGVYKEILREQGLKETPLTKRIIETYSSKPVKEYSTRAEAFGLVEAKGNKPFYVNPLTGESFDTQTLKGNQKLAESLGYKFEASKPTDKLQGPWSFGFPQNYYIIPDAFGVPRTDKSGNPIMVKSEETAKKLSERLSQKPSAITVKTPEPLTITSTPEKEKPLSSSGERFEYILKNIEEQQIKYAKYDDDSGKLLHGGLEVAKDIVGTGAFLENLVGQVEGASPKIKAGTFVQIVPTSGPKTREVKIPEILSFNVADDAFGGKFEKIPSTVKQYETKYGEGSTIGAIGVNVVGLPVQAGGKLLFSGGKAVVKTVLRQDTKIIKKESIALTVKGSSRSAQWDASENIITKPKGKVPVPKGETVGFRPPKIEKLETNPYGKERKIPYALKQAQNKIVSQASRLKDSFQVIGGKTKRMVKAMNTSPNLTIIESRNVITPNVTRPERTFSKIDAMKVSLGIYTKRTVKPFVKGMGEVWQGKAEKTSLIKQKIPIQPGLVIYHGTGQQAAENIIKKGFNKKTQSGKYSFSGFFGTTSKSYAVQYAMGMVRTTGKKPIGGMSSVLKITLKKGAKSENVEDLAKELTKKGKKDDMMNILKLAKEKKLDYLVKSKDSLFSGGKTAPADIQIIINKNAVLSIEDTNRVISGKFRNKNPLEINVIKSSKPKFNQYLSALRIKRKIFVQNVKGIKIKVPELKTPEPIKRAKKGLQGYAFMQKKRIGAFRESITPTLPKISFETKAARKLRFSKQVNLFRQKESLQQSKDAMRKVLESPAEKPKEIVEFKTKNTLSNIKSSLKGVQEPVSDFFSKVKSWQKLDLTKGYKSPVQWGSIVKIPTQKTSKGWFSNLVREGEERQKSINDWLYQRKTNIPNLAKQRDVRLAEITPSKRGRIWKAQIKDILKIEPIKQSSPIAKIKSGKTSKGWFSNLVREGEERQIEFIKSIKDDAKLFFPGSKDVKLSSLLEDIGKREYKRKQFILTQKAERFSAPFTKAGLGSKEPSVKELIGQGLYKESNVSKIRTPTALRSSPINPNIPTPIIKIPRKQTRLDKIFTELRQKSTREIPWKLDESDVSKVNYVRSLLKDNEKYRAIGITAGAGSLGLLSTQQEAEAVPFPQILVRSGSQVLIQETKPSLLKDISIPYISTKLFGKPETVRGEEKYRLESKPETKLSITPKIKLISTTLISQYQPQKLQDSVKLSTIQRQKLGTPQKLVQRERQKTETVQRLKFVVTPIQKQAQKQTQKLATPSPLKQPTKQTPTFKLKQPIKLTLRYRDPPPPKPPRLIGGFFKIDEKKKPEPRKAQPGEKADFLGNVPESQIGGIFNRVETTYGQRKINRLLAGDVRVTKGGRRSAPRRSKPFVEGKGKDMFGFKYESKKKRSLKFSL